MFFKNDKNEIKNDKLIKIAALLIHTAKIDEDYSDQEESIIKQTLLKIGAADRNIENIIKEGKNIDQNSNQILDFTKEVKNMSSSDKIEIVEALWKIIYSNDVADTYESSLMRRLGGLLYIDNKTMGNIKEKIKNKISQ